MGADAAIDVVANVVALNGGRLVGRTRFQKTMYLLSRLGVQMQFDFEYHHYGPFAAELADAIDAAVATEVLTEKFGVGYHDSAYSIFTTDAKKPVSVGGVRGSEVEKWLGILEQFTGTDLELAATILYLRDEYDVPESKLDDEVKLLKPVKASDNRLKRAWHVLAELGLNGEKRGSRARALA